MPRTNPNRFSSGDEYSPKEIAQIARVYWALDDPTDYIQDLKADAVAAQQYSKAAQLRSMQLLFAQVGE